MGQLEFRVSGSYGDVDLAARFDDHTTIGQLADELEQKVDRRGDRSRTIQRTTRGTEYFARGSRISQVDLRSGDGICLALDSGLRATQGTTAVANLRVVAGPDAGRIFELRRGESTVGRSSNCDIALNDDLSSRRHALLRVSDIVEVADAGSTNGVLVNDEMINGVRRLRPGDRMVVGDTMLVVDLLISHHEAVDVIDNAVEFNRPPRIERAFQPVKIKLPSPLGPKPKQRLPMIAALAPLIMVPILLAFNAPLISMAFIGLSPLMAFGSYFEQKRSGRLDYKEKKAEFEATMADQIAALERARNDEITSRFRFSPSNSELLAVVSELSTRLWEREPADNDFLHLRLGLKEQASQTEVELGQGGTRDDRREMAEIAATFDTLVPVPLVIDAKREAPLAIAGESRLRGHVARSFVLQAATLHSPKELTIAAILSEDSEADWSWLKWLPHTKSSPLTTNPLAIGSDAAIELLASTQELIQQRQDDGNGSPADEPAFVPHLVIVIDGSVKIERSRFSRLLDAGTSAGITVLWLTTDARRAPNACRSIVSVEPGNKTVSLGNRMTGQQIGGIPIEGVRHESAEVVARAMAPIVDISAGGDTAAQIPRTVSLVDLLDGPEVFDTPKVVQERWAQTREARALRAPIGAYDGGTLSIDLRVDGPHGLVGGTTGAGKSEFLQSLLAGLAASHSPDRINFLLVDYKGGSAFGELVDQFDENGALDWKGLRHTVGMITDLTPALVQRALVSLGAEVHRREVLLNEHRAKDLMEMEKRQIPGTPPSLLIVIDEFAALAKEVPAFVDGVVDIAQRGRSLGLHLLMATQKPGGVITSSIQANTNLRVALRMASEEESTDVVNSPIAGRIDRSTPGRGVIRRGPSDLVAFQSAYVGGVTTPASSATLELGELKPGGIQWLATSGGAPKQSGPEAEIDLKRLVRMVNQCADLDGLANPRRPWLDPLPDLVDLLKLPRPETDQRIPLGLEDVPEKQARKLATFAPDAMGSLLVYGMGGSGKTVALRSIAASFGLTKDRSKVHVYGLDFASRGLELLEPLPHVGSIIPGDDYERITRLIQDLQAELARRAELFAAARASTLTEYRESRRGDADMPRLVVLLDGFDNFQAAYERIDRGRWCELLPRLVADGRQLGVHFILTGTRRSTFPMALSSQVSNRLVFRMASEDDYHAVGVDPKLFDDDTPAGRCRIGKAEVQMSVLGGARSTADEALQFRRLGAALAKQSDQAPAVQALPEAVRLPDLPAPKQGLPWLLTETFEAIGPDLSQHTLIAGRSRSGKTTALHSLVSAAREAGQQVDVYAAEPAAFPGKASDFDALADRLNNNPTGLIAIDDLHRLTGHSCEFTLQGLLTTGQLTVLASADSAAARGYDQTMRNVRSRCDTTVLQPDFDQDGDLLGGNLPRTNHRFSPGQGYSTIDSGTRILAAT